MRSLKFAIVLFVYVLASCSDESNPAPDNAHAVVNGVELRLTTNSATAMGPGLDIKLAVSADNYLVVRLNNKTTGTYAVLNSNGGIQTGNLAYVEYVANGNMFYGTVGEVLLTENVDGTVSGQFEFIAEDANNTEVTVTSGEFLSLAIAEPPPGCRLIQTEDNIGAGYIKTYGYNGDGSLVYVLIKRGASHISEKFIAYNVSGKPIAITQSDSDYREFYSFNYTGDLVSECNHITGINLDGALSFFEFGYTSGQFSSYATNNGCQAALTHAGENLNSITWNCGWVELEFSEYDLKNSAYALITKALNNQQVVSYFLLDTIINGLSINNPGKVDVYYDGSTESSATYNFFYQYGSNGYPTKISDDSGQVITLTYSGCN